MPSVSLLLLCFTARVISDVFTIMLYCHAVTTRADLLYLLQPKNDYRLVRSPVLVRHLRTSIWRLEDLYRVSAFLDLTRM